MTMATQHTLLLVDDQSIFMDGMEALLGRIPEVQIVGKANNGADAVALVHELKPTLVLMDINMPGMDGIEASKRILKANPDTRILVLSMYGHKEFVLELMDSGVSGYLLKTTSKDELLEALNTVAAGGKYLARELRELTNNGDRHKDRECATVHGALTKREVQVVKLILREHTTLEIAAALFVSPDTVESHRRNIMHKLDVRNTAGLVKYAVERGWGE